MPYPYQIQTLDEYHERYNESIEDPEKFWSGVAQHFAWKKPWDKVLNWNFAEPKVEWFSGGKLNITENCLDRHVQSGPDTPAIIWEPNDPDEHHRVLNYKDLYEKVCQ